MKPNHYPPTLKRHLAAVLKRTFTRKELTAIHAEAGKILRKRK